MLEEFFCHLKRISVVGIICRESVKVRDLFEDLEVPGIDALSYAFLVSIIGVDNGTDAALPEIVHTLQVIEVMEHTPSIAFVEELLDRFKKPAREKMNMKVDNLVR